jgi:hypothetical protein
VLDDASDVYASSTEKNFELEIGELVAMEFGGPLSGAPEPSLV